MSREDEALDMVLESAAKIAAWWQDNHQPGPKDVVGLYDLARDTYNLVKDRPPDPYVLEPEDPISTWARAKEQDLLDLQGHPTINRTGDIMNTEARRAKMIAVVATIPIKWRDDGVVLSYLVDEIDAEVIVDAIIAAEQETP